MTNEIATIDKNTEINEQDVKDYLLGAGTKLSDEQFKMFLLMARSHNLNPAKREIYAVPYEISVMKNGAWTKEIKLSIVTGYQVYIDRAVRTGKLNGWKIDLTESGAKITIHRKDFDFPIEWEVEKSEFLKKNKDGKPMGSWASMPNFMIKKIAIGQGMRIAFPEVLSGMLYLEEEQADLSNEGQEEKQSETKEKVKTVGVSKVVKKEPEVIVAEIEIDKDQTTVEGYIEEVQIPKIEEKLEPVITTRVEDGNLIVTATPANMIEEPKAEALFAFEVLLVGIQKGDDYILKYIFENFFKYSKSSQNLINEHLVKNKRNPIIEKVEVQEEIEDISKNAIVQSTKKEESVTLEEVGEIFDTKPEITVKSILAQCIILKDKMKYTFTPEQIMDSLIKKEFPGRTIGGLPQEDLLKFSNALQRKIDSL